MKKGTGKKILSGVLSFTSGLAGKSNPVAGTVLQVVGLVKNKVVDHLAKNKASEVGGEGKTDFAELAGIALFTVISLIGLALIASGKITFEQLMQLLELL
jgi:hypothetical protein